MSNQKPGMFTPALIGGAVAGVLSSYPQDNGKICRIYRRNAFWMGIMV